MLRASSCAVAMVEKAHLHFAVSRSRRVVGQTVVMAVAEAPSF
jgi:hypothetical protein